MPKLKQYLDWRGYFLALYKNWIHSLTSTLIALGGTNVVESMGIKGVGLNWQQAVGVFLGVTFWEVVKYLNSKPLPETVEEVVETTITEKTTK